MYDQILFVELPLLSGKRTLVQVASIIAVTEGPASEGGKVTLNTTGGFIYLGCTYDETMVAMGQAVEDTQ